MSIYLLNIDGEREEMLEPWGDPVDVSLQIREEDDYLFSCQDCGVYLGPDGDEGEHAEDCESAEDWEPPEVTPAYWCNAAGIRVNEGDNSVQVWISVGDPRGAFTFTIRRLEPEGEPPRLIMHLPYPGEGLPHMKTTQLHPGTLQIGEF